jgi:phosphoribosylamine--glycine ligase
VRVLLLGGGGREHALAWKLSQSPQLEVLFAAPGNPGIGRHARRVALSPNDPAAVLAFARAERIDLVVVGPEAPLLAGVPDALRAAGIDVFGPNAGAARIEGSKAWAKELMAAAGVPTARSEVFTDVGAAAARALAWGPVVVKADGLAAGKGVIVADTGAEAADACRALAKLPAGASLLLEERLVGPELSVIALTDGTHYALLPPAQDHKRLLEGDRGPNTGGMGAYAPANLLSPEAFAALGPLVFEPVLAELRRRGSPFSGALYAGLMLTAHGPRVLEFNARLGDPETQPLLMQLDEDLLPLLRACARGTLETRALQVKSGASVGVVLAAGGYPEAPRTGDVIEGLDRPPGPGVERFHAGTLQQDIDVVTQGGRVMTVCAHAESFSAARAAAYAEVDRVTFAGRQVRRDIGAGAPEAR